MTSSAFAPAKINLFLHVGAVQPDGFHPLSSLMVFADAGDRLELQPSQRLELVIDGPFGEGLVADGSNLVLRAVQALLAVIDVQPPSFRLRLSKQLPIAAGLGGGSSDAGAALRLVRDHFALPVDDLGLEAIAAGLGSDGAACFRRASVLASGRGERLAPVKGLPPLDAVLVNPRALSPTGAVYRAYDEAGAPGSDTAPAGPYRFEDARDAAAFLRQCRNDLEPPAVALVPQIGAVLDALRGQPETLLARVSGSGATCFALCADPVEAARLAERVALLRPEWWVQPCRLGTDAI